MQSLEVISINFWLILISLCNLLILFLIIKHFLYKPIKRVISERQDELNKKYKDADNAKKEAELNKKAWDERLQNAQKEADELMKKTTTTANYRSEQIISEAKKKADGIVHQAQINAQLEHKKVQAEIKEEIADISSILTEKMIGREIRTEDHRDIIDSFIKEMGEDDDSNN